MGPFFVQLNPNRLSGLWNIVRRTLDTHVLSADLNIDDIVGPQRFYDMDL
jgi:hypothetical protein